MHVPELAEQRLSTAKDLLWTPFNVSPTTVMHALQAIGTRQVDDADIFFQYATSEHWRLEEGIVKTGSFDIEQGFGLRAVTGEKTAFAFSDDISAAALDEAARTARSIASSGQDKKIKLNSLRPVYGHNLYAITDPLISLDSAEKIELLLRLERIARAKDPRIKEVIASLSCEYDVVLIARLDGTIAADVRPLVLLNLRVIAEQNQNGKIRKEAGSAGGGGRYGLEQFSDLTLESYAHKAVSVALSNLESLPAKAGEMVVVLGPGWPGILLHEAIGHGLEGDFNRKESSAFSQRLGQRVAAPGVTVLDDGTLPLSRGSLNIDDEGHPTTSNVLIDNGVLVNYIQDRLNARLMGRQPTGNGRRESYAHSPLPRMTNTFMRDGSHSPEEIIASIDKGVYAVDFGGGQVDITSGKFVFSTSSAFWVEKGKIQYPIKGATLIGNGPDVLTRVSMIGNDSKFDPGVGTCGKEGQSVPVSVGQPTLRIDKLTVGGTV